MGSDGGRTSDFLGLRLGLDGGSLFKLLLVRLSPSPCTFSTSSTSSSPFPISALLTILVLLLLELGGLVTLSFNHTELICSLLVIISSLTLVCFP